MWVKGGFIKGGVGGKPVKQQRLPQRSLRRCCCYCFLGTCLAAVLCVLCFYYVIDPALDIETEERVRFIRTQLQRVMQNRRELRLSQIETQERLEKVQQLVADNLEPSLKIWRDIVKSRPRKRLTMNDFFRTVNLTTRTHDLRHRINYFGILNNKLFRPHKDGPARYNATMMRDEHSPNKDSAEWSVLSLWLALEEAMAAGMQFPNVIFIYNALDQPICNNAYTCELGTVPPISVMGYNVSLLPPLNTSQVSARRRSPSNMFVRRFQSLGHGDLLVSLFRYTGHSADPSIHPHHPYVVQHTGKGDPEWSTKMQALQKNLPWDKKVPKLFFRGVHWCPYLRDYGCPRSQLSRLSKDYPKDLDIAQFWPQNARRPWLEGGRRPIEYLPMPEWVRYKYLAALDGIAASSRNFVLYHMGSTVLKQKRTGYVEWYYQSLRKGVHYEDIWDTDDDAVEAVRKLKADDARARQLAENAVAFARDYLVKEVMMVYTKRLLQSYRDLFEDMDEFMATVGDPGNSARFMNQKFNWRKDWHTVF